MSSPQVPVSPPSSRSSVPQALSPAARALAHLLRSGDVSAAQWALERMTREAPTLALTHFIDAQLAYAAQDWARLITSLRRCWTLGGRDLWVMMTLGGVAKRLGCTEVSAHLERARGADIPPLELLPEQLISTLKRLFEAPLPKLELSQAPALEASAHQRRNAQEERKQGAAPDQRRPTPKRSTLPPPDWLERTSARQSSAHPTTHSTSDHQADWLERSRQRARTAAVSAPLPSWMEARRGPDHAEESPSALSPARSHTLNREEVLERGAERARELEHPSPPLLALELASPLLAQPGRERRSLRGRFLLVAYQDHLALIDLARPQAPWRFKRAELSQITSTPSASSWSLSVGFVDQREINFNVSAGIGESSDRLTPFAWAGEQLSAWLTSSPTTLMSPQSDATGGDATGR